MSLPCVGDVIPGQESDHGEQESHRSPGLLRCGPIIHTKTNTKTKTRVWKVRDLQVRITANKRKLPKLHYRRSKYGHMRK